MRKFGNFVNIKCANSVKRSKNMSVKNLDNQILSVLAGVETISPDELAKKTDVSPSTVRRRVRNLCEKGLVKHTHGLVRLNRESNFTESFTFRKHRNSLEKKRIALEAVKLVKNGDVIFLDGSSSAFFIAQYLDQFDDVKVITNGIDTLSLLSQNKVNAYSTGGRAPQFNGSVLVDSFAIDTIKRIHADICFLSALTIDDDGNIWDTVEEENSVRREMIASSAVKVFLCDSSKLHKKSTFKMCSVCDFDYMVCDEDCSGDKNLCGCKLSVTPS